MTRAHRKVDLRAGARGVTAADGSRKAAIERAALTLFVERGVDAATTKEIAARAQISEGALYYHYKSKEDLAETLFFAIHRRLAELVREAGLSADGLADQARAIVAAYCATADDDWTLFEYHLLNSHRFLPGAPAAENPVYEVEAILEAAAFKDAPLVAAMALGVVLQPALHKVYGRIKGDLAPRTETLSRAVIRLIEDARNGDAS